MNPNAWIEAIGWTLIHSLWQGAALAAFLWLAQALCRRARPQVRYVAGCAALFLLVALAGITFTREIAKPRATAAATQSSNTAQPEPKPLAIGAASNQPSSPSTVAISSGRASLPPSALSAKVHVPGTWPSLAHHLQPFLPAIVAAWLAGVLFFFLRLCRSWSTVQKLRRSGDALESWRGSLTRLATILRVSRPVRVLESVAVRLPMVIGWLKPVVLLPCSVVSGLSREQVEAIIAHELAHIRRHDYLVNLVQNAVETLFFFHPCVWWISAQIRSEREHCCDDLAAAAIGGAVPYVAALAALEEVCTEDERLVLAATGGSLLVRARRLLSVTPAEGPGSGAFIGFVAFLAVLAAFALPLAWSQLPATLPSDSATAAQATPQTTGQNPSSQERIGVATTPGRYQIASGIWLQVSQIASGNDGEPTKRINTIAVEKTAAPERPGRTPKIKLPDGLDSYALVWVRGTPAVWIGEANRARKVDLTGAADFPLTEVLETIASPADRDALRAAAEHLKAGGSPPEEEWAWDAPGNFGNLPEPARAELIKRRPAAPRGNASNVPPSLPLALPAPDQRALVTSGTVVVSLNNPWKASGRVVDERGAPMSGVEIWVHTGEGTLFRTGLAKTDSEGRYSVSFRPGIHMEKESSQMQFANITAHKPGWFEKNLNRQGAGAGAMRDVSKEDLETFKVTREQLVLPDKPREVNFVMAKAVTIKGKLVGSGNFPSLPPQDYRRGDEKLIAGHVKHEKAPLARWKVWLTGPVLAPATGVFASAETDAEGRFEFKDIPTGYQWQIQADTHERGKDPRSALFTPEAGKDVSLEVEMDEKQAALKLVPGK